MYRTPVVSMRGMDRCTRYDTYEICELYELYELYELHELMGCMSCMSCMSCMRCMNYMNCMSCMDYEPYGSYEMHELYKTYELYELNELRELNELCEPCGRTLAKAQAKRESLFPLPPSTLDGFSPLPRPLIGRCQLLRYDWSDRCTARESLRHPYFREIREVDLRKVRTCLFYVCLVGHAQPNSRNTLVAVVVFVVVVFAALLISSNSCR